MIAESLADGTWPRVLGLRYPATDIPRQAHALCIETPLRYAPSRDHSDVALLTRSVLPGANLESDLNPQPEAIDIGIAHLRAQSPIHRAYLERFNVNGSMSLSILNEGRLWGLLIFHHRVPHPVTPTMRQRLIEFAGFSVGTAGLAGRAVESACPRCWRYRGQSHGRLNRPQAALSARLSWQSITPAQVGQR